MTPTEYNESLIRLGAAAGLIGALDLDAIAEQADSLETMIGELPADAVGDDGERLNRGELTAVLTGIRKLVEAARAFLAVAPPELLKRHPDAVES